MTFESDTYDFGNDSCDLAGDREGVLFEPLAQADHVVAAMAGPVGRFHPEHLPRHLHLRALAAQKLRSKT